MTTPATYIEAIDAGLLTRRAAEGPRSHLGYSSIGHEDERKLWLEFRWCLPPIGDPRILRIFDNGNLVEDMLARWTVEAGIRLETRAPDGKQFRFSRFGGHLGGSMDGAAFGVPEYPTEWLVWESKSANDARFKGLQSKATDGQPPSWEDLETEGLKAWSPEYYAQVICYMGESGMQRAVVIVYAKNGSQLHTEFVEADPLAFQTYVSKAERIITAEVPPSSSYSSAADWRAKLYLGDAEREVYWTERLPPSANCRNCRFSSPDLAASGAQWLCGLDCRLIGGVERQWAGCPKHQFIPALMPARLIDTLAEGVKYVSFQGEEFINGPEHFSSKELIELSKDEFQMLSDSFFKHAREELGATVDRVERINQAIVTNAKRAAEGESDQKFWDPWPDEDIPF